MNRGVAFAAIFTIISAVTMVGQGCQVRPSSSGDASGSSSGSSSSGGSATGVVAFKDTFYAFTQVQGCVKCHASVISPKFAQPDVQAAYLAASTLIDFSNPDASIIAVYAGNSHCSDTPCSDPNNTPKVKALLESWAAAELGSSSDPGGGGGSVQPKFVTASVALPTTIPTLMSSATPAVVRFQLSAMSPQLAATSNAIAEVEIQMANPTTYRINKIKIMGNTAAVSVKGVHVYLKTSGASGIGTEDPNQGLGWVTLQATAPSSSLPATLPAGPLSATPLSTMAIQMQQLSTSNVMTLGFDDLQ